MGVHKNIQQQQQSWNESPTPTSSSGYSRTQIEKIIEDYHGDDISLLHSHAVNFGKSLSSKHNYIEIAIELGKVEL